MKKFLNQTKNQEKQRKKPKEALNLAQVTQKRTEKKTIKETMSISEEKLESFSIHNHINITQLHMFKCMKDELKEGEIIISEGFSENYALKQQNEITTVHWSNK